MKLNVRDKILDLSSPRIMGILNTTPDSFSDGGSFNEVEAALAHIDRMVAEGADIIDVGGESTRPGSDPVSTQEELDRVLPVLEAAVPKYPDTFFSVDTTKYEVAEQALAQGVHLVNDVSGLQKEPRLADLCAEYGAGYILMHAQGDPKTMQQNPAYDDVVNDVFLFFREKIALAENRGVQHIIIDPGIGFGKTLAHNVALIDELRTFQSLQRPILVGTSRKSIISDMLGGRPVDERLIGTIATHYHAMMNGARIIRVHDVKEARDSLIVFNALSKT